MKENVGRKDQAFRSIVGPLMMFGGYRMLNGRAGQGPGLAALVGGALIAESAITRTCPFNRLIGVDSRKPRSARIFKRMKKTAGRLSRS